MPPCFSPWHISGTYLPYFFRVICRIMEIIMDCVGQGVDRGMQTHIIGFDAYGFTVLIRAYVCACMCWHKSIECRTFFSTECLRIQRFRAVDHISMIICRRIDKILLCCWVSGSLTSVSACVGYCAARDPQKQGEQTTGIG